MYIECKICGKKFKNKIQYRHLKNEHNMTVKEYELLYGLGSSKAGYTPPEITKEEAVECRECGDIFKNIITNTHLKLHSMTVNDYRQKYGDSALYSESYKLTRSKQTTGANNPNYGKNHKESSKIKISNSNLGREGWSKGIPRTEEEKNKISAKIKRKYANNEIVNPRKGVRLSEEQKRVLSEKQKEYANNNKKKLSERGKKAYKTMLEKYGEEYMKERHRKMISSVSKEGKEIQKQTIINENKRRKKESDQRMISKMEEFGYRDIVLDDTTISYICPNGKFHTNRKLYFYDYRFNDANGHSCRMCTPNNSSKGEQELYEFVCSLVGTEKVINSERKVIWPYELDIFIPSLNIAIEYNGLYYHSVESGKDKLYHYDKYHKCKNIGIQLIQVFEDEWETKREIIKNVISAKLGFITRKIHARKCQVVELSTNDARRFVDEHHVYGYKPARVKLGLMFEGEIVQVMTFSAGNHSRKQEGFEIDRFCTKFSTVVNGGASKLYSHFVKKYKPDTVTSYADLRFGEGNVYKNIGFELEKTTAPGYFYFKTSERIRIHRYSLRKTKEENKTGLTEFDIRAKEGYYRIYDAGHHKWTWTSDSISDSLL